MAQIQGIHDDTFKSVKDQRSWKKLEQLVRKKLNSSSDECDCPSSTYSELSHKKIPAKNLSRRSEVSQRSQKKDKHINPNPRSRRNLNSRKTSRYDKSHQNLAPTLCDQPRILEKSICAKRTIKHQGVTTIKSVNVVKSSPRSCCSALNRKANILTKPIAKSGLMRGEKIANKFSESSHSPVSSPVDANHRTTPELSLTNDEETIQRVQQRQKKSEEFRNDCNSLENSYKYSREKTYSRSERGNRSPERSYKRQGLLPADFENKEMIRKVKNHQIEKFPYGLSGENRKLCRMLKTQDAERSLLCTCEKNKSNDECDMFCKCSESTSYKSKVKSTINIDENDEKHKRSLFSPKTDTTQGGDSVNNSNERNGTPDKNSTNKSLTMDLKEKWDQHLENVKEEYQKLSSELKEARKEFSKNERPRDKEIAKKKYIPMDTLIFEVQSRDYLNKMNSTEKSAKQVINDTPAQTSSQNHENPPQVIGEDKDKLSAREDETLINNVKNLINQLNVKDLEMEDPNEIRTTAANCQTEYCKCDMPNTEEDPNGVDPSTSTAAKDRYNSKKSGNERIKRHEFTLPRIVMPEPNDPTDVRKIFIYANDGNQESPLTVYRTSSCVKCKVKENKRTGYRYVLTYVQKYVSPTWHPYEHNDDKARSQELLKNNDYG